MRLEQAAAAMDKEQALRLAAEALANRTPPGQSWLIIEDHCMEFASAWMFFYNSKEYIETNNVVFHLAGNGPIAVNKKTGKIDFYGSTPPLTEIINSYKKL